MLKLVKMNILIPLNYNSDDFSKCLEVLPTVSKTEVDEFRHYERKHEKNWFGYCFRNKPVEKNFQMANSPLTNPGDYFVGRIELNSGVRSLIGINNNVTSTYRLSNSDVPFNIGMIRLLFIKNGISLLHFEIETSDIENDECRNFISYFGKIVSSRPCIHFEKRISRDELNEVKISFKELVENVINLQKYIPLSLYGDAINPYIQINMIGGCGDYDKMAYFDSIQALSPRSSVKEISDDLVYRGREDYIIRFAGDRTFCIFGDTDLCGDANYDFLINKNNGLIKTATENYTTVYAFLVSFYLMLNKAEPSKEESEYIVNMPKRLSEEDNIREFYEKCLWENGWRLNSLISELKDRLKERNIGKMICSMSDEIKEIKKITEETHEITQETNKGVTYLVDFVNTELKTYIKQEKKRFNSAPDKDTDAGVGRFIENTSNHINEKVKTSGDEIIRQEEQGLMLMFGDNWKYLMDTSKISLISAGTLLKKCADINVSDFDYSGISICCTSALEAELRRIFFDGLIEYMINTYGYPALDDGSVSENWPDPLLAIPRYQITIGSKVKIKDIFTMGNLPFLFGETGKLSERPEVRNNQLEQARLTKARMTEYLCTIMRQPYNHQAFESLYIENRTDEQITSQKGCFVWKCEKIRVDYRNKAAHTSVVTAKEASLCYQSILSSLPTRSDTYIYNAEIIGVILELFEKIDGFRIQDELHREKGNENYEKQDTADKFSVGDVVEVVNLEVTTRGGIRGRIKDTSVRVTLSPKYLTEAGINARQFKQNELKVKLIHWDDNGQTFNGAL